MHSHQFIINDCNLINAVIAVRALESDSIFQINPVLEMAKLSEVFTALLAIN